MTILIRAIRKTSGKRNSMREIGARICLLFISDPFFCLKLGFKHNQSSSHFGIRWQDASVYAYDSSWKIIYPNFRMSHLDPELERIEIQILDSRKSRAGKFRVSFRFTFLQVRAIQYLCVMSHFHGLFREDFLILQTWGKR